MTNLSFTASMQDYNSDKCLVALSVHDAVFIRDTINHYMLTMSRQSAFADISGLHEKQAENILKTLNQIINYHDDFFCENGGV